MILRQLEIYMPITLDICCEYVQLHEVKNYITIKENIES